MPVSVQAIHHVSLLVADTALALNFYQGVLGLEVEPARPDLGYPGAWLRVGDLQIHLLELPNPDPMDGRPTHGVKNWLKFWTGPDKAGPSVGRARTVP